MRLCRSVASVPGRRLASSLAFANGFNPEKLSGKNPLTLFNYVDGNFAATANTYDVVDPLNGASRGWLRLVAC
jgi:hypothetical protein